MNDELIRGNVYRVKFQHENQRKPREMIAKYAGWSRFYTGHTFDLRPAGGDLTLMPDSIISVSRLPAIAVRQAPRIVQR